MGTPAREKPVVTSTTSSPASLACLHGDGAGAGHGSRSLESLPLHGGWSLQTPRSGDTEHLDVEPQPISACIASRCGQDFEPRSAAVCPCSPTPSWTVSVERQEHTSFYVTDCSFLQLLHRPSPHRTLGANVCGLSPPSFSLLCKCPLSSCGKQIPRSLVKVTPPLQSPTPGRGMTQAPSFARCRAQHGTQARESLSRQEPQGHTADAEFVGLEMGLGSKRETESASC